MKIWRVDVMDKEKGFLVDWCPTLKIGYAVRAYYVSLGLDVLGMSAVVIPDNLKPPYLQWINYYEKQNDG